MTPTIIEWKCRLFASGIVAHCEECRHNAAWRAGRQMPDECPHGYTVDNFPRQRVGGPGTELKRILSTFGIEASKCGCDQMANKMDNWGEHCGEHIAEIVASMTAEAKKRKWMRLIPMKERWAEMLVLEAIDASKNSTVEKSP